MIKKAKDADVYTPDEIKKMRERIEELNGIPIKEIGVLTLISTVEQLQKENERLQAFIENLQVVHFTELQREKAKIEDLENEVRRYKDRNPTNPGTTQRGLEFGC